MENATKALLIAGSVLIAIVLIAVGIKILSSTSGVTKEVDNLSSTMEASIFNSRFTQYEGTQKGTAVRALYRLVKQNNLTSSNRDIGMYITDGSGGSEIEDDSDLQRYVVNNNTYTVSLFDNNNDGYVDTIEILE